MQADLNRNIAGKLDDVAALLEEQGANPFRVRAYRSAAVTLRDLHEPVADLLEREGTDGLERLAGIGPGLARAIRDAVRLGYLPMLERLRGETDPVRRFAALPGVGRRLAARLHDELGFETLEDLEAAAHDGRLESLTGFGEKRVAGVRDVLAHRLARTRPPDGKSGDVPDVAELLELDREYRRSAEEGRLSRIAPRRFNPGRRAWLPILHAMRDDRHYTVLFSNTALAHRLGRTHDWVVIYADRGSADGQWTVVTATSGPLRGRRVVRGREPECLRHYGHAAA